ncbi:MAG: GDP-mannose 4,6-dehydratase [Candidatus Daviesbacteria bacterium]|nr:GDP-mannose 4,6-dehydratase [Candidatus Daviesbacteria bacterium]
MKIIVTGGAGFLGSYLCEFLLNQGDEVICVDNLLTSHEDNIKDLITNPNFKFLKHDITEDLPADLQADQIYHLASPASPNMHSKKSYHALPFETMAANTTGTWKLAQKALDMGAKFLFASTSEIYGDPLEHPQKEEYRGNVSTTGPRAVYDESKRFGETITATYIRSKNLDGRIIRIFNTYGPKMALDDGRVVLEFILAALKNEPIPIFGDGTQTRSFCYVTDLIKGIVAAMNTENTKGEVFNLGNGDEYTVMELAEKIKLLTNSQSEIKITEPMPEDDPTRRRPDITRAKEKLHWEPQVSLDEGLAKMIEYLKNPTDSH